jgi:hypothetical protein
VIVLEHAVQYVAKTTEGTTTVASQIDLTLMCTNPNIELIKKRGNKPEEIEIMGKDIKL